MIEETMAARQDRERHKDDLVRIATVAVAAFLSLLGAIRYGWDGDTIVVIFVVSVLVVTSRYDLARGIIPNRIVLPAWIFVLGANLALHPHRWAEWLLGSFGAGLFFLVVALVYRGGLGMGDVKLAAFIGAA